MEIINGVQAQNEVRHEGTVAGEAIAIAISDSAQDNQWVILVFVQTPQGEYFLGGLTTNTPTVDGAPARIVAFASCPGAVGWKVRVRNSFPDAAPRSPSECWVIPGKCCGGGNQAPGVIQPPQPPGSGGGEGDGGFTPPVLPS